MPKKQLLLATGNPSKAREITAALADLDLEILTLADVPPRDEPAEDGETFEANAAIKAEFWARETGFPALADDSGILVVDALPGELGVHTVRFGAGKNASDEEWLDFFLEKMKDVPDNRRGAKFVSVIALARPDQPTEFFQGETCGKILREAAAPLLPRIPLSSVFLADGCKKVFAAMTTEEKAANSHRGRALEEAKKFLAKNF